MSTAIPPTHQQTRRYLHQIGHQLLATRQLDVEPVSTELQALEALDALLQDENKDHLERYRALYASILDSDLQHPEGLKRLNDLKAHLNDRLQALDQASLIKGKARKTFLCGEAGIRALEQEARLGVQDRLLAREHEQWVQNISKAAPLRPGLYALSFEYQDQSFSIAGAFVLTEKATPRVDSLTASETVGGVLLFTPFRGLEPFESLAAMDAELQQNMGNTDWRDGFRRLLPRACQHLDSAGIWPLQLTPIEDTPLFEYLYEATLAKRRQDIDWALGLADNPDHDNQLLGHELHLAVKAALADLSQRLELRAHLVLELGLFFSSPDWYRSADVARRTQLAEHIGQYNQARQNLTELLGVGATPQALAHAQLLERLDDDLETTDLDPHLIQITTQRKATGKTRYEQTHTLAQLAVDGLHQGDERNSSDFLQHTQITYHGAALARNHRGLTPGYLVRLLPTLQPRLDFCLVQQDCHSQPVIQQALETMLDARILALAYTARLQNHLNDNDLHLIKQLQKGTTPGLNAQTVSLHNAALNDLWVLRQQDPQGRLQRLLLCTPEAPRLQQFWAFASEADCQAHILNWSQDKPGAQEDAPATMSNYLLERVALRFRPTLQHLLDGLGFIPAQNEHLKVMFTSYSTQALYLTVMRQQLLTTQVDDYNFITPPWYRSAAQHERRKLTGLAADIEGALRVYKANPLSDANFDTFERFLHRHAKRALNTLLGLAHRNEIDPDTVWVRPPPSFIGTPSPPMTYTQLYRDGYEDGIGFLSDTFSTSATFTGPKDVDLTRLTPEKVARSVTGVWIGQRYSDEMRTTLQSSSSPGYTMRRSSTLDITQLQMRYAALQSRLTGHISGADLDWLERAIDSLGSIGPATRNTYRIHRLTLNGGDWVMDNLLFSNGLSPVLLYTPNAPDGVAFREARLFNYLLKHVDGMLAYFLDRVPKASQARVRSFLQIARARLPEQLDKTTASPARYDAIEKALPLADLRRELYDLKLQRKIDDVQATTVNRTQMIMNILWSCVEWITAIVTIPYPIWSLSAGLLLAFKDGMLALNAYHQGRHGEALQHYLGYLFNSVGALATDLRPALKGLVPLHRHLPVGRLLSQALGEPNPMALIKQLQPPRPSVIDVQPITFRGEIFWARNEPDPLGRFLLFRKDDVSGELLSTAMHVNPGPQGNWIRSGYAAGGPKYKKLPDSQSALAQYELTDPSPLETLQFAMSPKYLAQLKRGDAILDDVMLEQFDASRHLARHLHLKSVRQLTDDAQAFFRELPPITPRADVLEFDPVATHSQVFEAVFRENNLLMLGETHPASIASKQLLINNLKSAKITRLYIEYLPTDVFRTKLEKMNRGGSMVKLEAWLEDLDQQFGFAKDADFSYSKLVLAAREQQIPVYALDASSSYKMDKLLEAQPQYLLVGQSNDLRNFYSHKVLQADLADLAEHSDERWVALVDQRRLMTYKQVPGLADLHKAIGIRIEDIAQGPTGIYTDVAGAIPGDATAKADFRLTLQTPYRATPLVEAGPARVPPRRASRHFDLFDAAPEHQPHLARLEKTPGAFDGRRVPEPGSSESPAYNAYLRNRERLDRSAEAFFTHHTPTVRTPPPTLTPTTTAETFAQDLCQRGRNLVIGEVHQDQASKQWVMAYLKQMKKAVKGRKTLYMEHLKTDLHQADLDTLYDTGRMPKALKSYLKDLDQGYLPTYSGPHTYSNIVAKAAKYKIRIKALDCVASYHEKGLPDEAVSRTRMFNYLAYHIIQADQAAQGPHLWAAFVGNTHTDRYLNVPGLTQLHDAVSLHVHDVAPELGRTLHPGYWQVLKKSKESPSITLRSDFKVDAVIQGKLPAAPSPGIDTTQIRHVSEFLVEQRSSSELYLWHRSGQDILTETPIRIDENGQFHIDRWDSIKAKRYTTLEDLESDLKNVVRLRDPWN